MDERLVFSKEFRPKLMLGDGKANDWIMKIHVVWQIK